MIGRTNHQYNSATIHPIPPLPRQLIIIRWFLNISLHLLIMLLLLKRLNNYTPAFYSCCRKLECSHLFFFRVAGSDQFLAESSSPLDTPSLHLLTRTSVSCILIHSLPSLPWHVHETIMWHYQNEFPWIQKHLFLWLRLNAIWMH